MEIREIQNKEIWEEFIRSNSPQSLFQSWNWGEVVKRIQNSEFRIQNLWRLGIYDKDKLMGIAQVNKVIARKGNFLHVRHGPIFSEWSKKSFLFLLAHLKELAKKEKVSFVRISPLIDNSDKNQQFFKAFGFIDAPIQAMDGEYCWVLDLKKTEEELLVGMRKTTRYLIRQAQKFGVVIAKSQNINDMDEFLSLYRQTALRHRFVEHKGIREEFEVFLGDDQILLFKGHFQNKFLSVALVIFYNNQAIYHHSASVEQKIPVNYLLQWELIKEAKRRGKSIYNLWGIAPPGKPRHPWRGLTIFKQGFGGEAKEYLHAKDLPCSLLYCATYLLETARRIWKGY